MKEKCSIETERDNKRMFKVEKERLRKDRKKKLKKEEEIH